MTAGIANAFRSAVFSGMNCDKAYDCTRSDNTERGMVSALQMKNSASSAMEAAHNSTGTTAQFLNSVSDTIKTERAASKTFDYVCKGVNALSEWVNPILVGASLARVYYSDDKQSASIEEAGAMTGMFTAEGAAKRLLGLNKGAEATYNEYKMLKTAAGSIKDFCASNKYLSKLPPGKVGGVIKGLSFIAASCTGFSLGGKIGKTVADNTTAKTYAEKHALEITPENENSTKEFVS